MPIRGCSSWVSAEVSGRNVLGEKLTWELTKLVIFRIESGIQRRGKLMLSCYSYLILAVATFDYMSRLIVARSTLSSLLKHPHSAN